MKKILAFLLLAFTSAPQFAGAQSINALIVANCGTAPFTYTAGQVQPVTMDTRGNLCGAVIAGSTPLTLSSTGVDVAVTPTIQNASYVSGNNMGGLQTVALGTSASVLSQVSLSSQGGLATAKQIYIFSANPTGSTFTDKGTFTIATADLSKLLYSGSITPAAPTGTTKTFGALSGLALGIPSGGTIYAAIVETTTETPATTTDLVLMFSAF